MEVKNAIIQKIESLKLTIYWLVLVAMQRPPQKIN